MLKKGLAVAVILLSIGVVFVPSISSNVILNKKTDVEPSFSKTFKKVIERKLSFLDSSDSELRKRWIY